MLSGSMVVEAAAVVVTVVKMADLAPQLYVRGSYAAVAGAGDNDRWKEWEAEEKEAQRYMLLESVSGDREDSRPGESSGAKESWLPSDGIGRETCGLAKGEGRLSFSLRVGESKAACMAELVRRRMAHLARQCQRHCGHGVSGEVSCDLARGAG